MDDACYLFIFAIAETVRMRCYEVANRNETNEET